MIDKSDIWKEILTELEQVSFLDLMAGKSKPSKENAESQPPPTNRHSLEEENLLTSPDIVRESASLRLYSELSTDYIFVLQIEDDLNLTPIWLSESITLQTGLSPSDLSGAQNLLRWLHPNPA